MVPGLDFGVDQLVADFTADNLESMRLFYQAFPPEQISETLSRILTPAALAVASARRQGV